MIHRNWNRPSRGHSNWLGLKTLYMREVQRFIKISGQTVVAPIVTTFLFLTVFNVAFGSNRIVAGLPYIEFLGPGLIMMAILQNTFANTSTSLIQQKLGGTIIDVIMPPLSAFELTAGYLLGGITRGAIVALAITIPLMFFAPLDFKYPQFIGFYALSAAFMMSSIGMITGIWAEKFDHVSTVTNFVILPLSFMSGTFFSINRFPDLLQNINQFNPFFYLIDGFRYGITGLSEGSLFMGFWAVSGVNLTLFLMCLLLIKSGYKLKS